MNAIKKSFKLVNGVYTEKQYGPNCGLEWTDASGNKNRAIVTNMPFDVNGEKWSFIVSVFFQASGKQNWLPERNFTIIADENSYRNALTGEKAEKAVAFGSLIKYFFIENGTEVEKSEAVEIIEEVEQLKAGYREETIEFLKDGFITSAEFFTILFGYNPKAVNLSMFDYVYNEIALKEGLTI